MSQGKGGNARVDDDDAMTNVAQIYEAKIKMCEEMQLAEESCPRRPLTDEIIADRRCERRQELLR